MMKRRISVTTGTRAEYGILRPVLKAISKSDRLDLYLIVTGMHLSKKFGFTVNEIKKDGFKIYAMVNTLPKGNEPYFMSKTLGETIIAFSKIFRKLKPHINIILGDRDEMFASAITAYHMNIPNAHIHGGDKSGSIDEYTRHAITKISNIHFVATAKSKERVLRMGENPKYVFLTGSPSIDEISSNNITSKKELQQKYNIVFQGNEILLLQHPVTTEIEETEEQIRNILNAIVKIGNTTIAIAPNSDAGHSKIFQYLKSYAKKYDFIKLFTSLPRRDYLGMLKNCSVLVGNSSSGMIEASYFHIPVVNIGIRQKGRERGRNVIDVKNQTESTIYRTLQKILAKKYRRLITDHVYENRNASAQIVKFLERLSLDKNLIQKEIFY